MTARRLTAQGVCDALNDAGISARVHGDQTDALLLACTHDSRRVVPGSLFCCVPGANADGHQFTQTAVEAGAAALLVERVVSTDPAVPQIVVANVRDSLGVAAAAVHDHPADAMVMVGITGTNGKTSTAHMLGEILEAAGHRAGVIGTLTQTRTTPEATDLHERLAELRDAGTTHVVMEVTSHALVLGRVNGVRFAVAVFTNLSQDHLDFHGNMEAYFRAKALLFSPERSSAAVVNLDDPHGHLLFDAAAIPTTGFSIHQAENLESALINTFTLRGVEVVLHVGGRFSVSNALAAAAAAHHLGVSDEAIAVGLGRIVVPGRFEPVVVGQAFAVIVDYAHTPDGLVRVLDSARGIVSTGGRLITVFGCGGDRDRSKRPLMGEAAAIRSDLVFVTSDNPRSESPAAIINDVMQGIGADALERTVVETDRRSAIAAALAAATAGDVVVIAGKGHEQGQDIGGVISPFDDRAVARAILESTNRSIAREEDAS